MWYPALGEHIDCDLRWMTDSWAVVGVSLMVAPSRVWVVAWVRTEVRVGEMLPVPCYLDSWT